MSVVPKINHTFFAEPRFAGAAVFLVPDAVFGLPASAFLGATAFLVGAAGFAAALVLLVVEAFFEGTLPAFDLEGGLEFWG